MENLTKQQMILLALLVSFVTSIATGIVTVSLMDQAPQSVTQTINRVVERTVERVVPAAAVVSSGDTKSGVITKETVVVKDDDVVIAAVEKNKGNLVRIMKVRNEAGVPVQKFGGVAFPVNNKGVLVTDIAVLQKKYDDFGTIIPESYKAISADGSVHSVIPVGADEAYNLVYFQAQDEDGKADPNAFGGKYVSLADSDQLKLGQAVVALGGEADNEVSTGIVSALVQNKDKDAGSSVYNAIKTDIRLSSVIGGTLLINLSGDVAGILIGKSGGSTFLPVNFIKASIPSAAATSSPGVNL